MVIDRFVNPKTKKPLMKDIKGNLYDPENPEKILYKFNDGTYDFTNEQIFIDEKFHYNIKYSASHGKMLTSTKCYQAWYDSTTPENLVLLKSLGNFANKKILLLGNGISYKEFYFLHQKAKVVFTDLSIEAVLFMKELFRSSEFYPYYKNNIDFHAVNALELPFPSESFDIIYGYAFAHHIPNLGSLFTEVSRCLKKGGICRFLDDAYSPVWQFMKNTFLRPLQFYIHKKRGISPMDLIATKKGGYIKEELILIMQKFDFNKLFFQKVCFLQYFWKRGFTKLLNTDNNNKLFRLGYQITRKMDALLLRLFPSFMKMNSIRLIWGFDK